MPDADPEFRPQRRRRPQQARSRITVEAIVEAAAQVLERDGYEALTTASVAERAGVSIGTLYQYFPDKAGVVGALVEGRLGEEVSAVRGALRDAERLPLAEAADRVVGAFVGLFAREPDRTAAVMHASLHVAWGPVIEGLLDRLVVAVSVGLRSRPEVGEGAEAVAHVAVFAVFGIVMRTMLARPDLLRDGTAVREAQALVRGYLSAREAA